MRGIGEEIKFYNKKYSIEAERLFQLGLKQMDVSLQPF